MNHPKTPRSAPPPTPGGAEPGFHRSGAVARMLGMPVATLRIWERRYALSQPALSPSGQRLYSDADVQRLALVKRLVDLGHAIGSLAPLDMAQLQHVATTHAQLSAELPDAVSALPAPPARAWRLAVIGPALAQRLQRPALLRRLGRPVQIVGPFDNVIQAAAALQRSDLDALLVHEPQMHKDWLANMNAIAPALADVPKAVLYAFAPDAVCEALATAGASLLREPQPDAALAQWLHSVAQASVAAQAVASPTTPVPQPMPPRRWDDAALAEFADRPSKIACECPRHVAELLVQLAHFETYSAECAHRDAADAELHAYLRQVAAASRASFEAALERVALHEGLLLPSA
jgi:DNA-binding transcriptional MerR regulator